MGKLEKSKWQTKEEFEYKKVTGELSNEMNRALKMLALMEKREVKDYSQPRKIFKNIIRDLEKAYVPELFKKVHETFLNAYNAYLKGIDLLMNLRIDDKIAKTESIMYIQEGHLWLDILRIRIYESVKEGKNRTLN